MKRKVREMRCRRKVCMERAREKRSEEKEEKEDAEDSGLKG